MCAGAPRSHRKLQEAKVDSKECRSGRHHLTEEDVASTICFLERVHNGDQDALDEWRNLDALTFAGILAMQLRYLRGLDS